MNFWKRRKLRKIDKVIQSLENKKEEIAKIKPLSLDNVPVDHIPDIKSVNLILSLDKVNIDMFLKIARKQKNGLQG